MTDIFDLLVFEEGFRETPYVDSLGYPTVGIGMRIGPKGANIKLYTFTMPRPAAEAWVQCHLATIENEVEKDPKYAQIKAVMAYLGNLAYAQNVNADARCAVVLSMGYQMGLDGLAKFVNTLRFIQQGDWNKAADGMLQSLWAKQTPNRAKRHAEQMRTGKWAKEY